MTPVQLDAFAHQPAAVAPALPRVSRQQRAKVARDTGIERAGDHADREVSGWTDRAAEEIGAYARKVRQPFLIEDAREASAAGDPPDGRAWGQAVKKAQRKGLVRSCGYAPSKSSNLSPKVLWIEVL